MGNFGKVIRSANGDVGVSNFSKVGVSNGVDLAAGGELWKSCCGLRTGMWEVVTFPKLGFRLVLVWLPAGTLEKLYGPRTGIWVVVTFPKLVGSTKLGYSIQGVDTNRRLFH